MTSAKLQVYLEAAIFAALAIVLSMLPTNIGSSFTISLGMIPLTIYSVRHGVKAGLFAGLIWGLLHFLIGNITFLSVTQVLIEYVIAFTFAGFAGFAKAGVTKAVKTNNSKALSLNLIYASFAGTLARFFWHFVAGVAFWGAYALWGMNPFVFSLVMNGVSGLATAAATAVVLVIIGATYPKLFVVASQPARVVKSN